MTIIGRFHRQGEGFEGDYETLSREIPMTLAPAKKHSAKAPDFTVRAGGIDCGVAWRVTDTVGVVASVKLDDPSWPEPINARLMASEDGELPLVWIRRTDPPAVSAQPQSPATPSPSS